MPGNVECPICSEDVTQLKRVCVQNSDLHRRYTKTVCRHEACIACLTGWVDAQVSYGNVSIQCPMPGCASTLYNDDVRRIASGRRSTTYAAYVKLVTATYRTGKAVWPSGQELLAEIEEEEEKRARIENIEQARLLHHAIVSGDVAAVEALMAECCHLLAPGVGAVIAPADLAWLHNQQECEMVLLQHEQRQLEDAPLDETLPHIDDAAATDAKAELSRRVSYAVARAVKDDDVDEVARLVGRCPEVCAVSWPFHFSPLPVELASIFGNEELAELLAMYTPLALLVRTHNWCGQSAEQLAEANGHVSTVAALRGIIDARVADEGVSNLARSQPSTQQKQQRRNAANDIANEIARLELSFAQAVALVGPEHGRQTGPVDGAGGAGVKRSWSTTSFAPMVDAAAAAAEGEWDGTDYNGTDTDYDESESNGDLHSPPGVKTPIKMHYIGRGGGDGGEVDDSDSRDRAAPQNYRREEVCTAKDYFNMLGPLGTALNTAHEVLHRSPSPSTIMDLVAPGYRSAKMAAAETEKNDRDLYRRDLRARTARALISTRQGDNN